MCKAGGPYCYNKKGKKSKQQGNSSNQESASHLATELGCSAIPTISDLLTKTEQSAPKRLRLDAEQRESICRYVDHEYKWLNKNLRDGASLSDEQERIHRGLVRAMEENASVVDFPLYRGFQLSGSEISGSAIETVESKYPVGAVIEDGAWVSTSADPSVAVGFGRHVMEVENPDHAVNHQYCVLRVLGGRALDVRSLSHKPEESEFILPAGQRLRVLAHHHLDGGWGKKYMVVDVAPEL